MKRDHLSFVVERADNTGFVCRRDDIMMKVCDWRWLDVCSSGVLFARQSAIAGMTGHRGKHSNCYTQGKTSPMQFQPSCSSSSSSSSSMHGHRNSSPWVSCPLLSLLLLLSLHQAADLLSVQRYQAVGDTTIRFSAVLSSTRSKPPRSTSNRLESN